MHIKTLLSAAAFVTISALPSHSAQISLDFVYGDASGSFFGLVDDGGSVSASGFYLETPNGTYSYTGTASRNHFGFSPYLVDGPDPDPSRYILFSAEYLLNATLIDTDGDTELSLFEFTFKPELWDGQIAFDEKDLTTGEVTFPRFAQGSVTQTPVTPVPIPAGFPLLLTSIFGFAGLRWKKNRSAKT